MGAERKRLEAEAAERKKREEEEAERKRQEEEAERKRLEAETAERKKREEEEEAEKKRQEEEAERKRQEEEAAERKRQEEAERAKKEAEAAERKRSEDMPAKSSSVERLDGAHHEGSLPPAQTLVDLDGLATNCLGAHHEGSLPPAQLLHIRRSGHQTDMFEVPLARGSMTHGDAFILADGKTIYTWMGDAATPFEKNACAIQAENLARERHGKVEDHPDARFWDLLGGEGPIKQPEEETIKTSTPESAPEQVPVATLIPATGTEERHQASTEMSTGEAMELPQDGPRPVEDFSWYAIDLKKQVKERICERIPIEQVHFIVEEARKALPVVLLDEENDIQPGNRLEVRMETLANLQGDGPPGWWPDTAEHLAGESAQQLVLIQQWRDPHPSHGKRMWRAMICAQNGGPWDDCKYNEFTVNAAVRSSATLCAALLAPGSSPDVFPVPSKSLEA